MNDKELDILFAQAAQRDKAVEMINRQVMKTVRRDMRLKLIRKWARLVTFCFCMPATIVMYIYLMITYMPDLPLPIRVGFMVLPLGTMAICFGKRLHEFSPMD